MRDPIVLGPYEVLLYIDIYIDKNTYTYRHTCIYIYTCIFIFVFECLANM